MPLPSLLAAVGNAHGRHLHALACGHDDREVEPDRALKSIGHEETFPQDRTEREELEGVLVRQADAVAGRLRDQALVARTVTLKVRYGDFTTITRSVTTDQPVSSGPALAEAGRRLLAAARPRARHPAARPERVGPGRRGRPAAQLRGRDRRLVGRRQPRRGRHPPPVRGVGHRSGTADAARPRPPGDPSGPAALGAGRRRRVRPAPSPVEAPPDPGGGPSTALSPPAPCAMMALPVPPGRRRAGSWGDAALRRRTAHPQPDRAAVLRERSRVRAAGEPDHPVSARVRPGEVGDPRAHRRASRSSSPRCRSASCSRSSASSSC